MHINNIVNIAKDEWFFWGRQKFDISDKKIRDGKDEIDEGYWQRVGLYWRDGTGKNLTGKSDDYPWSAAFISYVLRKSGAANRFRYSAQHSVFICEAIKSKGKGK